jgi:hypothetical protein
MNKESLISDKISNIVMPGLIWHPEYNDLDCGFRLEKPPAFAGMTGKRYLNKFDIPKLPVALRNWEDRS